MKHNYLFAMVALLLSGAALLPLTSNGQIEYVDLGLPSGTLWANMNVGATKESDSGFYYQWGDTVTRKADFSWKNYKWCNGTQQHMTKYCTDSTYGDVDNKLVLDLLDDAGALAANVGSPTKAEFDELLDKKLCKWTLDTVNDRKGARVTGPNGNSIFLPAYAPERACRQTTWQAATPPTRSRMPPRVTTTTLMWFVLACRVRVSALTPATITAQDMCPATTVTTSVR